MENNAIEETPPLSQRLKQNPRPALVWGLGVVILVSLEIGAVIQLTINTIPVESFADSFLSDIPTLLSRDLVANKGYKLPGDGWQGTFIGLEPAHAWLIRVTLTYVYSLAWVGWFLYGYGLYRTYYRTADWTPRDDVYNRFRNHSWGLFGFVVVFMFLVMAIFAPTLGPTTFEETIDKPYSNHMEYYDEGSETVKNITIGTANINSQSQGTPENNVGPMSYDNFGRFHPFGTLPDGKDLFTFLVYGSRVSLFIGGVAIGLSAIFATVFGLVTAYYKGLSDLILVVTGDTIMSIPRLMLVILLSVVLRDTWLAGLYSQSLLLALIFAGTGWPFLWRAIRGPAFQTSEEEWIDAAKSFGQRAHVTMRKHMFPYIVGYLMVYSSMWLGGVIIATAGLSFLGFGVKPPTPEWGQVIAAGQNYVASPSWHISLIPGFAIVVVVTGFNAFGDGIRDAIDPQSETSGENVEAQVGGGA